LEIVTLGNSSWMPCVPQGVKGLDDDDDDDEYTGRYSRGNHLPSVLSEGQIMIFICELLFTHIVWDNSCQCVHTVQ
jgi:hypothetical protein